MGFMKQELSSTIFYEQELWKKIEAATNESLRQTMLFKVLVAAVGLSKVRKACIRRKGREFENEP